VRWLGTCALFFVAASAAHADPLDIALVLPAGQACPSPTALSAALAEHFRGAHIVSPDHARAALTVTIVTGSPPRLQIKRRDGRGLDRPFPVDPNECDAAAESAALIAATFWLERWRYDAGPDGDDPPPRRPPSRVAPPRTRALSSEARAAKPPPLVPAPPPPLVPAPPQEPRFLHFSMTLLVGVDIGTRLSGSAAFAGSASLDLGLGRHFGIGVRLGATQEFSARQLGTTLDAFAIPIVAYGRYSPVSGTIFTLSTYLGFAVELTAAQLDGAPRHLFVDGGAWIGLGGQWRIYRGLYAELGTSVEIPFRTGDARVVQLLPPAWAQLWTGLGWRFF
jgi:hypothetical protein